VLCLRVPSNSATFNLNPLRSCSTRFRPSSMKSSNLTVNWAIRSRKSLNPKSMLGRLSAIDVVACAPYCDCEPENELPKRLGVMLRVAMVSCGVWLDRIVVCSSCRCAVP